MTDAIAAPPPQTAEAAVKLRGEPPRVMRLSRKAVGIGAAVTPVSTDSHGVQ